jgi:hypothetical protein
MSTTLKKDFKSLFPAMNVHRRDEPVATDTVYSDTPAVDSGATSAQIFVGTETLLTDVYGMKTDKQFVNTLEDNIREQGAMSKLISDRAQVEISNKVVDILRALFISSCQSEPHQQHQNYPELVIRQSRPWVTPFLTVRVHHPIPGSFASRMFASSLTLRFHLHSMVESLSSAPPVLPTISARCSGSDSGNPSTTNLMIPLFLQNHVKNWDASLALPRMLAIS